MVYGIIFKLEGSPHVQWHTNIQSEPESQVAARVCFPDLTRVMRNRSVSDPEINLKIYNMLQRVMVCPLCGSHFGRRYSKALDLIVAQAVAFRWSKCVKL